MQKYISDMLQLQKCEASSHILLGLKIPLYWILCYSRARTTW